MMWLKLKKLTTIITILLPALVITSSLQRSILEKLKVASQTVIQHYRIKVRWTWDKVRSLVFPNLSLTCGDTTYSA